MDVLNGVQLVVFGAPRAMFSEAEFNCLRKYIDLGGSVLVMFTEGGEKELHTNINYLLEEFGIMVNSGENILKVIKFKKYFILSIIFLSVILICLYYKVRPLREFSHFALIKFCSYLLPTSYCFTVPRVIQRVVIGFQTNLQ